VSRGGWILGIDVGTSYTVGAVRNGDRAEVLEIDGRRRFRSAVMALDDGSLLVGDEAERRSPTAPAKIERAPKRYLERGQPGIPLGDRLYPVHEAIAKILEVVWDEALRQHADVAPAEVRLTHPAAWGDARRRLLATAAATAGIEAVTLLSEPEAAALYLAEAQVAGAPIEPNGLVAVYDLGGGTFDVSLLRRHDSGFEPVGEPRGDEGVGGDLFDERLYRWLGEHVLPSDVWEQLTGSDVREWRYANHEFRRGITAAKEAISKTSASPVYIPAPVDRVVQVTRAEFEELIRPDVEVTLDMLAETLDAAGARSSDLSALFLVGGSSRIPLVAGMVRERFGRADFKGDPKAVVALGAAQTGPLTRPPPPRAADVPGPAGPAPVVTGAGPARSLRDELTRDPRRELVLDLVEELVAYARHGVQRVLVLRDVALLEAHGIGADAVFDYAKSVAADFQVLQALMPGDKPGPWASVRSLVSPLEGRNEALDADLPWTRELGRWGRVAHPVDSKRERSAAKGKAGKHRARHGDAIYELLKDAAAQQPVLCLLSGVPHYDKASFEALQRIVLTLIGYSPEQPPDRILILLSGGRRSDPDRGGGRSTSLFPRVKLRRKERDRLILMNPFVVHQPAGAPPLASLEGLDVPPVRPNAFGVL
jgi:hypothetical protein